MSTKVEDKLDKFFEDVENICLTIKVHGNKDKNLYVQLRGETSLFGLPVRIDCIFYDFDDDPIQSIHIALGEMYKNFDPREWFIKYCETNRIEHITKATRRVLDDYTDFKLHKLNKVIIASYDLREDII